MLHWQLKPVISSGMLWKGILGIVITELWLQPPLEAMELIWLMALSTGALENTYFSEAFLDKF